jgi:asparagine synthase (glutamine-hydrolysing)
MCGIAGIVSLDGSPLDERHEAAVRRMTKALEHRGPDDSGFFASPSRSAILGHRRLSIIDLSTHAHQPYLSSSTALVFNGEILNYRQLSKRFLERTERSDTVALAELLAKRGENIIPELQGFFAFAYWDEVDRSLLIARDALGKKPLYYTQVKDWLVFASELRALVSSELIPFSIDREALDLYLGFYSVPSPHTMVEGIRMLEPGHLLRLRSGRLEHDRWWRLSAHEPNGESRDVNVREIRRRFNEAVASRLISDAPLGVFHSGGIDSNLVVAAAHELGTRDLSTFNVTFEGMEDSESGVAQASSRKFNTKHRTLLVTERDIKELLPYFFYRMDSPTGDGLNTFIVSSAVKAERTDVKVVLSGVGGDELFIGYRKVRFYAKYRKLASLFPNKQAGVWSSSRVKNAVASLVDPLHMRVLFNASDRAGLLASNNSRLEAVMQRSSDLEEDDLFRLLRLDIENYLPHTLLRDLDAMTMAHSQEARAPFLDRAFVEYAWQIPVDQKLKGRSKQMLIDAYADLLPQEVIDKQKSGFELPMSHWLRSGILRPFMNRILDGDLRVVHDGLLDRAAVKRVATEFEQGRSHYMKAWSLIALDQWYRSFFSTSYEDWNSEPWPA